MWDKDLTFCCASRSPHNLCPVKMKTLARAALRNHPPSSPLSRSMWMSQMVRAPRRSSRWSKLSKQNPSLRILPQLIMLWPGFDSHWPQLICHQQWMSVLVGCEYLTCLMSRNCLSETFNQITSIKYHQNFVCYV